MKENNSLTIGQVAKSLNIETHVIRYWETQFDHLKPSKVNKRRVYIKKDIENLNEIFDLLHINGYSIKGAQKYFKDKKSTNKSNLSLNNNLDNNNSNTQVKADIKEKIIKDLKDIKESLIKTINKLQNAL